MKKVFVESPKSLDLVISKRIQSARKQIKMTQKGNVLKISFFMVLFIGFFSILFTYSGDEFKSSFDSEDMAVNVKQIDWDYFYKQDSNYYTSL